MTLPKITTTLPSPPASPPASPLLSSLPILGVGNVPSEPETSPPQSPPPLPPKAQDRAQWSLLPPPKPVLPPDYKERLLSKGINTHPDQEGPGEKTEEPK